MSFLMPKKPDPPPTPTPAQQADASESTAPTSGVPQSLISTGSQGLKKKATTIKTSLLGGSQ